MCVYNLHFVYCKDVFQENVSQELNNLFLKEFYIFHQGVEIFDLIEIQGRQWRR